MRSSKLIVGDGALQRGEGPDKLETLVGITTITR
jgi:hypothetical protein